MCPCVALLFSLLVSVGISAFIYLTWHFKYWTQRGVKGPRPQILYGSVPSIVKRNRHLAFDMQDLYEKYKKSGERFIGIFMTRNPQIMVIDPKLVREIMVTNFKTFRNNEPSLWISKGEEVSARNPFFTPGHEWKERRADVVAGLTPSKLKLAYPIVMEACTKMTDFLKAEASTSGNTIDIKALCYKYTSEIMADFLWGIGNDSFKPGNNNNAVIEMSRKMLDESFMTTRYYYLTGVAPFLRKIINRRFFPQETDDFFSKLQKDAVQMRLRTKDDRPDFLNYLLQLQEKKNISYFDMVGHSTTVLLDGYETSALVLHHAVFYLASNQNAQGKLRDEIMANLNEEGGVGHDTLFELPYMDQCINETIRLISPIPVFSRACVEPTFLENREGNRVKIDAGMVLHIPTYALHHDKDIFPEPEEYIPERFDGGLAKELNLKGCFMPFGDGPRICAGMRLGQLETKAGLWTIIKNFKLKINERTAAATYIDPTAFIIGLGGDLLVEFEPLTS